MEQSGHGGHGDQGGHVGHGAHAVAQEHGHATVRTYILIAVVLALITIAEVAALYIPGLPVGLVITAFLLLSAIKFVLVVSFYMHLKYDSRFFTGLFGFFLLTAMGVAIAFIALFHGLYLL